MRIAALGSLDPGIWAALAAAALFGAGAPFAKLLLAETDPWLLAAMLYLGSGIGLALWRTARRAEPVRPSRAEWGWLAGATLAGGVAGPVLLMTGLAALPAASVSLLLNMESVLTAVLAWVVFRENVDRRVALGMALIVAGALLLSWPGELAIASGWPALAVLGACAAWALDNNLTRKVALADASFIAMIKGLSAGATNLLIAMALGPVSPTPSTATAAAALGFVSYGASLVLFVVALRRLGAARTGAYFSVAPFFGALLAVSLLGERFGADLWVAGALMACGVWLHMSERHAHPHDHDAIEHTHEHEHDAHHQHDHDPAMPGALRHTHRHHHAPLRHDHPHYPDAHHGHHH